MAKSGIYAFGVIYQTKVVYVYQDKIGHVEKGKISIWIRLSIFRVAGCFMNKRIGFIGCGNMGKAMLGSLVKSKDINNEDIMVSTKSNTSAQNIIKEFNVKATTINSEVTKNSDIIFLAVKPFFFKEVIIHEYLHYYCDTITGVSNGHNSYFKKMCRIMGISDSATFKYDTKRKSDTAYKYKIYCSKCNKYICGHKRIDFANNKVKKYISSCCKAKLIIK